MVGEHDILCACEKCVAEKGNKIKVPTRIMPTLIPPLYGNIIMPCGFIDAEIEYELECVNGRYKYVAKRKVITR